jgi:hypothetical protein
MLDFTGAHFSTFKTKKTPQKLAINMHFGAQVKMRRKS